MSQRVVRDFRRQAAKVADQTVKTVAPAINAALENERLTRERVSALEANLTKLTDYAENTELLAQNLANWRVRPFLGRLRWLFLGK